MWVITLYILFRIVWLKMTTNSSRTGFPLDAWDLLALRMRARLGTARLAFGIDSTQLKSWFFPRRHHGPVAVCLPPGARIRLSPVGARLRGEFNLSETEDAVFPQFNASDFAYRDGLRLRDGEQILLQHLPPGQRARVISTCPPKDEVRLAEAARS